MTNKYIEVVKRWQAGEEVSQTELEDNAAAAWAASDANADSAAEVASAAWVVARAAEAAHVAAARAVDSADVEQMVKRYEELTNEKEI